MAGGPSSLALYRKYRPATFAEVKGQDHVTAPLRQALLAGRVHHAYLFSGPRGCGKTSSARILARSLNCEQGPTPDPCGKCDSCVALAPGGPGSIDVIEIDAASHGGVDDARDLRERAFYAPVSGRFKIYIIDEAHMVTREGFNALLKLVEEPPPHLKFVFATTEPEKVIGTIRSRTHHYPFRLVAPQILRALLEEVLDAEGVAYEPAVLPLVVRAGAGSARDALSVLDQLLAGADESGISYAAAVSLLGYTDSSLLDQTVDAFAAGDGGAVFRVVDEVIKAGHDPRRFAADLLDRLRDLIVLGAVGEAYRPGLLDAPADQLDRMRAQVARFGAAELTRAAEVLNAGLTEMRGAVSPRLLLELTCARVLLPGAEADQAALLTRLERMERRLALAGQGSAGSAPAAPAVSSPAAPVVSSPAVASKVSGPAAAAEVSGPAAAAEVSSPAAAAEVSSPAPAVPSGDPPSAPSAPPAATPHAASGSARASRSGPGSSTAPRPPATAPGALDADSLRRNWDAILEAVRQVRKVSWIQLRDATVASLEGNVLTLGFARDGDLKGFTASRSDALLGKVLQERFGVEWRIQGVATPGRGRAESSGLVPGGHDQVTVRVAAPEQPHTADRADGAPASQRPQRQRKADPARGSQGSHRPHGSHGQGRAAGGLGPGAAAPADEADPDNDADAGAELTGMELIRRELGGEVISEIDHSRDSG